MNCIVIISGPSAVGKTSIAEEICKISSNIIKAVTCTTRAPRNGETHGSDYIFLSQNEFINHKNEKHFVESSCVYNNYYGLLSNTLTDALNQKKDVIFVSDVAGFINIKHKFNNCAVGFFILPPSIADLEFRMRARGKNNEEDIARRLTQASTEINNANQFDFCVENKIINEAANDVLCKLEKWKFLRNGI